MENIYRVLLRRRTAACRLARQLVLGLCLLATLAAPLHANAAAIQSTAVSGVVKDDTDQPLPGVNVLEKGTSNGTVTDADGRFTLNVASPQSVLVFSFVGMTSQQVSVGTQSEFNIQLLYDARSLSEVVVVGYGTQEKKDITGAVASVKSEDFNRGIINSPEQLVQGKVAGVNVTSASGEPGTRQTISIRGPGGVRTSNTPLFVVDGMALDNTSTGGVTNPLNFLNPSDIESIDVLKDASATAIYGSRGANGVVMITTKKGKAGTTVVNYSGNLGWSTMARPIDVFSADEYRRQVPANEGTLDDGGANTDWQKVISRTAFTQNHDISFGGGSEKFTVYGSLGYQNQEGILKNSNMKRYTGRINMSQKLLNDRVTVEMNLNATNVSNERPPIETIIGTALGMNPTYKAYNDDGTPAVFGSVVTPLIELNLTKDYLTTNRIIGNISPSVTIIDGLVYKLNVGIDNSNSVRDLETLPSAQPVRDGRLESQYTRNTNSLIEHTLNLNRKFGEHSLNATLGYSYQKVYLQNRTWSINKFPLTTDVEPIYNPGLGQDLTLANNKPSGGTTVNELQSFFGRVIYDLKGKYLATATVRVDGSTKFGANNQYGTFPSVSLGWRISEEEFLKGSNVVSNLKLRAGWGQTGNQEIPSKYTQPLFTTQVSAGNTYPLGGSAYPAGTTYTRVANPDLQWEVSTQTDLGLDFGFLNGALSGTIDVFNKESQKILLQTIPADPVQPAQYSWSNIDGMTVTNRGVELSLNYRRQGTALRYEIGGNLTLLHNEVEGSPYTVIPTGNATGSGLTSATINGYVNGEPIGTFFLKQWTGFDANGMSTYLDKDGDGVVTDKDRVAAGSALPTTMYNFYGMIGYKGFDLTLNFNGVSGNKVYDNTANANFYKLKINKGLNTTAEAVAYPEEDVNNPAPVSTRYLKDGAFLRLNNATLGYTFNTSAMGINNWVKAIRLSVTGQNLWLSTRYDGYDPEVNTDRAVDSVTSYGIDYQSYPKAKSFIVGLNVTF